MMLSPPSGYLGRNTVLESGQYLSSCQWKIEVPEGQLVSLNLFSFQKLITSKKPPQQHTDRNRDKCSLMLMLQDGGTLEEIDLCGRGQREIEVYRSESSSLEMSFYSTGTEENIPHFILNYLGKSTRTFLWNYRIK